MRTNNYLVDFANKFTYVASKSLVQEAQEKHSDIYLNFAYTDYGGSFLDKVIISYFKEYYPGNIVHEKPPGTVKTPSFLENLQKNCTT